MADSKRPSTAAALPSGVGVGVGVAGGRVGAGVTATMVRSGVGGLVCVGGGVPVGVETGAARVVGPGVGAAVGSSSPPQAAKATAIKHKNPIQTVREPVPSKASIKVAPPIRNSATI